MKSKRMMIASKKSKNNINNNYINNTLSTINLYNKNNTLSSFLSDKDSIFSEQNDITEIEDEEINNIPIPFSSNDHSSFFNYSNHTERIKLKSTYYGLKQINDDNIYEKIKESNNKKDIINMLIHKVNVYKDVYYQNEKIISQLNHNFTNSDNDSEEDIQNNPKYRKSKLMRKALSGFIKHHKIFKFTNIVKYHTKIEKKQKLFNLLKFNRNIKRFERKRKRKIKKKIFQWLKYIFVQRKIRNSYLSIMLKNIKVKVILEKYQRIISKKLLSQMITNFLSIKNYNKKYLLSTLINKQIFKLYIDKWCNNSSFSLNFYRFYYLYFLRKLKRIKKEKIKNKKQKELISVLKYKTNVLKRISYYFNLKEKVLERQKRYYLYLISLRYLFKASNTFSTVINIIIKQYKIKNHFKHISIQYNAHYLFFKCLISSYIKHREHLKELENALHLKNEKLISKIKALNNEHNEISIDYNKLIEQIEYYQKQINLIENENAQLEKQLNAEKEKYKIIFNNNLKEIQNLQIQLYKINSSRIKKEEEIDNDILNIIDEKESNINKQKKLINKYENETLIKKCENLLKKK